MIQDEIQSFHLINKQATSHLFIYYFCDEETGLVNSQWPLDNKKAVVHTFQKKSDGTYQIFHSDGTYSLLLL